MDTKSFRTFVETGVIEEVIIFRQDSSHLWTILVEGDRIPARFLCVIETAKQEVRGFADLTTAYGVVRSAGWQDSIIIQG